MAKWNTNFERQDISHDETTNFFTVKAHGQRGKQHKVHFGDKNNPPNCTCYDWKKHLLPCVHFCAVFRLIPGWTWEQLSVKYNPVFSLDAVCIQPIQLPSCSEQSEEIHTPFHATVSYDPLTERKRSKRKSYIGKCIASLKSLIDVVYTLQDVSYLEKLEQSLMQTLREARQRRPQEDGIVILDEPTASHRGQKTTPASSRTHLTQ